MHQRVAKKFRAGRAILAGDSAHVNSPIGAMGMNSGVHDAFNLAGKLIRILRNEADDSELDRYERQGRHVAIKHTQVQTMRNKRLLAEQDPAIRKRNNEELRRTAEDPKLSRAFLLRSSSIESLREAEQIARKIALDRVRKTVRAQNLPRWSPRKAGTQFFMHTRPELVSRFRGNERRMGMTGARSACPCVRWDERGGRASFRWRGLCNLHWAAVSP